MCRIRLVAVAALGLLMAGCGSTVPGPAPVATPFYGYYESLRPEGIYLFATLSSKKQFDRGETGFGFREYVERTGLLVSIHAPGVDGGEPTQQPTTREIKLREVGGSLVERIARGFEETRTTQLLLRDNPDAPPVDRVRPELDAGEPTTRQSLDEPATGPTTRPADDSTSSPPEGNAPGTAADQPGENPVGRQEDPAAEPGRSAQEVGPGSGSTGSASQGDGQQVGPGSGNSSGSAADPAGGTTGGQPGAAGGTGGGGGSGGGGGA